MWPPLSGQASPARATHAGVHKRRSLRSGWPRRRGPRWLSGGRGVEALVGEARPRGGGVTGQWEGVRGSPQWSGISEVADGRRRGGIRRRLARGGGPRCEVCGGQPGAAYEWRKRQRLGSTWTGEGGNWCACPRPQSRWGQNLIQN
jgi:hypothetical protein